MYIIPIVQALIHRIVPCIRALVVVPSRDLAIQAKATFDQYVKGTDLRVGMLGSWGAADSSLDYHDDDTWLRECNEEEDLLGTYEEVDIAITTPGRLVEHIKNNPQFDIQVRLPFFINAQNLQYLIVDEADKLLLQSFSNWIHVVRLLLLLHRSCMASWKKRPSPSSRRRRTCTASARPSTGPPATTARCACCVGEAAGLEA